MVEKFLMSSTNALKLSKCVQKGLGARPDLVGIDARRERYRVSQRVDRAIAIADVPVLASKFEMRERQTWK